MPGVTRLGDLDSGHGPWPPRPSVQASPNVFANKIPVHRVGDLWMIHCFLLACHPSTLASGSSTVFVNGKPAGRIGDDVACGSVVVQGSGNVFIGG